MFHDSALEAKHSGESYIVEFKANPTYWMRAECDGTYDDAMRIARFHINQGEEAKVIKLATARRPT